MTEPRRDSLADLSAYLDGELSPEQVRAVERELAQSPAARQVLEELRDVRAQLAGLPHIAAPPELAATLAAATRRAPRPWRPRLLRVFAPLGAVAAALLLVLAMWSSGRAPRPMPAPAPMARPAPQDAMGMVAANDLGDSPVAMKSTRVAAAPDADSEFVAAPLDADGDGLANGARWRLGVAAAAPRGPSVDIQVQTRTAAEYEQVLALIHDWGTQRHEMLKGDRAVAETGSGAAGYDVRPAEIAAAVDALASRVADPAQVRVQFEFSAGERRLLAAEWDATDLSGDEWQEAGEDVEKSVALQHAPAAEGIMAGARGGAAGGAVSIEVNQGGTGRPEAQSADALEAGKPPADKAASPARGRSAGRDAPVAAEQAGGGRAARGPPRGFQDRRDAATRARELRQRHAEATQDDAELLRQAPETSRAPASQPPPARTPAASPGSPPLAERPAPQADKRSVAEAPTSAPEAKLERTTAAEAAAPPSTTVPAQLPSPAEQPTLHTAMDRLLGILLGRPVAATPAPDSQPDGGTVRLRIHVLPPP